MKRILLTNSLFQGAISLEETEEYVKPWRILSQQRELFVPDHINGKAEIPAGVRITFRSNTKSIQVQRIPEESDIEMDCVINGCLIKTGVIAASETTLIFNSLPVGTKLIEIYLSQKTPIKLSGLWIDNDASLEQVTSHNPHWIVYGSSITQCVEVESPSKTWPALAAQQMNLNLTCLGFDGNCHLEPMMARMIRDTPADFISLCVGINIMGRATLSSRTFAPALIGFIQLIREKQPDVPIAVVSPIYCRGCETTENVVGLTLVKIRDEIVKVFKILRKYGDENLYYINGLELFGKEFELYLPDGLHPNTEGYRIMAQRFKKFIDSKISFKEHHILEN